MHIHITRRSTGTVKLLKIDTARITLSKLSVSVQNRHIPTKPKIPSIQLVQTRPNHHSRFNFNNLSRINQKNKQYVKHKQQLHFFSLLKIYYVDKEIYLFNFKLYLYIFILS